MDVVAIDDDNKIYDAEMQVKNTGNLLKREDVGVRYMQEWEREHYIREEGREKGREEGREVGKQEERSRLNELTKFLIRDGRMEDILRGTEAPEYQEVLLKEYGLN